MKKPTKVPAHHRNGDKTNEWDMLNKIKVSAITTSAAMTAQVHEVSDAVKTIVNEHMREPLVNVTEEQLLALVDTACVLADDVRKHQEAVIEVAKSHEGKTGGVRSDDQQMETMSIASNYHNLTNDTVDIASDTLGDLIVGISEIVDNNKDRKINKAADTVAEVKTNIEAKKQTPKEGK